MESTIARVEQTLPAAATSELEDEKREATTLVARLKRERWAANVTALAPRILLVSVFLPLACSTAYHARQPQFAPERGPTNEQVVHCLQSIGFVDESTEEWHARFISEDPELVAIWSTPPRSFWSATPGCTAAVRLKSGAQHVVFVPFSGSTSGAAQALSGAFEHCVELHAPDADIEVDSEMFLDLR